MTAPKPPALDELGRDLLRVPAWRVSVSLTTPCVLAAAYFGCAFADLWIPAVGCVVALSFVTYGSISHDLVHRALGLPRRLNDLLLSAIELLLLRSGRAYQLTHLNHHARYPNPQDDPEATAAYGTLQAALLSGPLFFVRLWWWAVRHYPEHRPRLIAEGCAILTLVFCAVVVAATGLSSVPLAYAALVYLGTWVVPLATAYIPHTPDGDNPLSQTRRFRGWVARVVALDHLYHLEHHLYPAVPHHRWPELARRLNAFLDHAGVPIVRLGI
jgi:beta-carotene hydroxylase